MDKLAYPKLAFVKGKFVNGVKHRINGDVLTGQFKKLLFSGEGRMTWTLGHIQEGTFVNDQLIQGRKEWPSGDWLEGTFTREGFSGTGKYTGRSGIIQEGIFENWKLIKGRRYRAGQLPQDNISPPPPDLSSDFPPPTIRIVNFPRRQKRSICLIG